jgi:hypothetical protein
MTDKKPIQIIPGSPQHLASQSVSLTVAAMRKAQGKPDPNDFPVGTPEFEAAELDFLEDVLSFMDAHGKKSAQD